MPFVDTNSHLTTRPSNFDIKCHSNSESYDRQVFFGTKFRGGQIFIFTVGGFFNEREYSEADCPDLLKPILAYQLVSCWSVVGSVGRSVVGSVGQWVSGWVIQWIDQSVGGSVGRSVGGQ